MPGCRDMCPRGSRNCCHKPPPPPNPTTVCGAKGISPAVHSEYSDAPNHTLFVSSVSATRSRGDTPPLHALVFLLVCLLIRNPAPPPNRPAPSNSRTTPSGCAAAGGTMNPLQALQRSARAPLCDARLASRRAAVRQVRRIANPYMPAHQEGEMAFFPSLPQPKVLYTGDKKFDVAYILQREPVVTPEVWWSPLACALHTRCSALPGPLAWWWVFLVLTQPPRSRNMNDFRGVGGWGLYPEHGGIL